MENKKIMKYNLKSLMLLTIYFGGILGLGLSAEKVITLELWERLTYTLMIAFGGLFYIYKNE